MTPPSTIELRWCPECDRTDRASNLPDSHVKIIRGGSRIVCKGTPQLVTYTAARS